MKVSHSVIKLGFLYIKCSWLEQNPNGRKAIAEEAVAFKKLDQCSPFKTPWNMAIKLGPDICCILTKNAGESIATLLDADDGEYYLPHLDNFLRTLESWIGATGYDVGVESLTVDPWVKSGKMLVSLLSEGENHHSLERVEVSLQAPPRVVRVFEEHGDLHLENVMLNKRGEITLIDPRFGVYPIAFPYLKMLYMWTLLHSGANSSHLVVQKILDSVKRVGLSEDVRALVPTTLLRIKYPQMMEPKFHHLLNHPKPNEVIAILDFILDNL